MWKRGTTQPSGRTHMRSRGPWPRYLLPATHGSQCWDSRRLRSPHPPLFQKFQLPKPTLFFLFTRPDQSWLSAPSWL